MKERKRRNEDVCDETTPPQKFYWRVLPRILFHIGLAHSLRDSRIMTCKIKTQNRRRTEGFLTFFQYCLNPFPPKNLPALSAGLILIFLTLSSSAQAQGATDTATSANAGEVVAHTDTDSEQPDIDLSTEIDVLKQRISALEASRPENIKLDNLDSKKEIKELKQAVAAQASTIEKQTSTIESLEIHVLQKTQEKENKLKLYGFMDVRWSKTIFYQEQEHYLDGMVNGHNTFVVGHWNLFVERQLTESFRAMGEVRFLFQPLGETTQWADSFGNEFERANVTAVDHPDAYFFSWGGISMERVWIEYKPSDHFGIKVGKFLTPFSMWNVDHSPTVIIPIHMPYLITGKFIPPAQTGLYLFGRAFPSGTLSLLYGLTLSNGEGPTTEFYDLDDKKAVGANLGLSYDGAIKLDIGTYVYMGDYTDVEIRVESYQPLDVDENVTVAYRNKAISANLKFEWEGLLLQGEYMRSIIHFEDGKRFPVKNPLLDEYERDSSQWAAYGLIGYRLPFRAVSVMPFLMYEYVRPPNWADTPRGHLYGGGINWRINPFAVLKAEFYHQQTAGAAKVEGVPIDFHVISTQLAITY